MQNGGRIVAIRDEADAQVLRLDDDFGPVGRTVVVIEWAGRPVRARVRLPDGAPVEVFLQRPTEDGYELVFHEPLPPGTRIILDDDTVLNLPSEQTFG